MPSSFIADYRAKNPNDPRSDAALILDLGEENPAALTKFPDFAAEYQKLRGTIDDSDKSMLTTGDYVKQAAGSLGRGVSSVIADVPAAIAVGADWLDRNVVDLSPADGPVSERSASIIGEGIKKLGEKATPDTQRVLDDSFWATKLPQGLGSALGFMLGGEAGVVTGGGRALARQALVEGLEGVAAKSALKTLRNASVAGLGAASGGMQGYRDAIEHGADEDTAFKSFLLNAGVGTSEILPLSNMLNRLDRATGGLTKKTLFKVATEAGKETVEEALQEAMQQTAQNIVAKQLYDKDRTLLQDVGENASIGGVTGFTFSLLTHGLGHALHSSSGDKSSASENGAKRPDSAEPSPAPAVSAEPLNPARAVYSRPEDITPQEKTFVEQVISRELNGDTSIETQTALNQVKANPNLSAFYTLEKPAAQARQLQRGVVSDGQKEEGRQEDVLSPSAPEPVQAEPTPVATPTPVVDAAANLAQLEQQAENKRRMEEAIQRARLAAVNHEAVNVAAAQTNVTPTPEEKEAGDYKKGVVELNGLKIAIETPKGATRSGVTKDGQNWSVIMPEHYGEVKGSEGADADPVDVYVGPDHKSGMVWIVDQVDADTRAFDEHKAMLAFPSEESALEAYRKAFSDGRGADRIGAVTSMTVPAFREWVKKGDTTKALSYVAPNAPQTAPVGPAAEPVPVAPSPAVSAADFLSKIISVGTSQQVVEQEAKNEGGIGQKLAQAIVENPNPDEIYRDSRAEGSNKNLSRKLAVLLSPDGKEVLIATAYDNRGRKVAQLNGKGRNIEAVISEGWQPIAALKSEEPTKGYAVTYSFQEWKDAVKGLKSEQEAARRTAAAVEDQIARGADYRRGKEDDASATGLTADELVTAGTDEGDGDLSSAISDDFEAGIATGEAVDETVAPISAVEAIAEHIDAGFANEIFDTLDSLTDGSMEVTGEVMGAALSEVVESSEREAKKVAAVVVALHKTGLSYEEARHAIVGRFLKAYKDTGSSEGFVAEITKAPGPVNRRAGSERSSAARGLEQSLKHRAATVVSGRPEAAELRSRFYGAIDALTSMGVPVELVREQIGRMYAQWGAYHITNGREMVTLALADALNPTRENLVYLLHEAAHAVFARLPLHLQAQLHAAIGKAADEALGIGGFTPKLALGADAAVAQEERLVESTARRLVDSGFDASKAMGAAQTIWRMVKAALLRSTLAIQRMLGITPSQSLAQAYFRTRMESALAGRTPRSAITFLGGPRPSRAEQVEYYSRLKGDDVVGEIYNFGTGQMEVQPVLPDSIEAGRFNDGIRYRGVSTVGAPTEMSADVDSSALAGREVSAQNSVDDALRGMFDYWDNLGHNTAGLTYDQFLASGNFVRLKNTPAEIIADRNARLVKLGQPQVPPNRKLSDLPPEAQKETAVTAHRLLSRVREKLSARRLEAEGILNAIPTRLTRSNTRLSEMLKNYTNADFVLSAARKRVDSMLSELRDDLKDVTKYARKIGTISQVIRQLEGRMDGNTEQQFKVALERLYKRISGDTEGRKFFDMLQRVAQLNLPWRGGKAADIRDMIKIEAEKDALLAPLLDKEMDGRVLLSTVIAFGKRNRVTMDLLQLRLSKEMTDRTAVNLLLKQALSDSRDAIKDAKREAAKLPKLGKIADRLLTELEEEKARNKELLDSLVRERAFVAFHQETLPLLYESMARAEKIFGATHTDWEATHNAEFYDPIAPTATPKVVVESKRKFSLKPGEMKPGELKDIVRRQTAWLEAQPTDGRGALWNTIKVQRDKLGMVDAKLQHDAIQGDFVTRFIGSIADRLDRIGHPASKEAARMVRKVQIELTSRIKPAEQEGIKWAVSEGDAMKALGWKLKHKDLFRKWFFARGAAYMAAREDLYAQFPVDQANEKALAGLKDYLENDPDTRDLVNRPGAWAALEKFYRRSIINTGYLGTEHKAMGGRVLEENGSYHIFRDLVGAAATRMPRHFNGASRRLYQVMRGTWTGPLIDGQKDSETVKTLYTSDRPKLAALLDKRFGPVWKTFVRDLVYRPGRSVFYAPADTGGIHEMAMRERVIKAYESTDNLLDFSDALYALEGGATDTADFAAETYSTFNNFFRVLHEAHQDVDSARSSGMPVPSHVLLDARKINDLPPEWLDYTPLDKEHMRQVIKLLAFETGAGRDMSGIRKHFEVAQSELGLKASELKEIEEAVLLTGATGKAAEKAVKDEAERRGGSGYLTVLKTAHSNASTVRQASDEFTKLSGITGGGPEELRPWLKWLHTIAAATVQGPGTALSDLISLIEQPIRLAGLNATGIRWAFENAKSSAADGVNSLLQAVGSKLRLDSENASNRFDLGFRDNDAVTSMKDKVKAAQYSDLTPMSKAAEMVNIAMHTPIGMGAQPGATPVTRLKPLAIFSQVALHQHAGTISGAWNMMENMIGKAVKHFESNPLDKADAKFEFSPKQIGMARQALEYFRTRLVQNGMSLEEIARDYMARRAADPSASVLLPNQLRNIGVMAMNEVMLETNMVTRNPGMLTNPLMMAASPLVGWSVSKLNSVAGAFREPGGEASRRAFGYGLLAYAAILPLSIAWALLREEYDETLLGKKPNVQGFGENSNTLAALEKIGRIGTFGIAGDLANSMLNGDTNRPFSVDTRVLFVSSLLNARDAVTTLVKQHGTATYSTVYHPLLASLGGSGYLQYADIINNALGLDNAESRVTARTNVGNILRAAGRGLEMDVRTGRGMASLPTPTKPYISQMVLASYANDHTAFAEAYRNALVAARVDHKDDAENYVAQTFSGYNPLRSVFRTPPTDAQYARLLSTLEPDNRAAVLGAVRLFNGYSAQIGGKIFEGAKTKTGLSALPSLPKLPMTLNDARRRAASFGSAF